MNMSMNAQESGTNTVFDPASGGRAERLVFNHRLMVLLLCAVMTVLMAYVVSTRLSLSASYEKMLPQNHPYVLNYLHNSDELSGLGGALRVVVANPHGEIFDPQYLELLRQITD